MAFAFLAKRSRTGIKSKSASGPSLQVSSGVCYCLILHFAFCNTKCLVLLTSYDLCNMWKAQQFTLCNKNANSLLFVIELQRTFQRSGAGAGALASALTGNTGKLPVNLTLAS